MDRKLCTQCGKRLVDSRSKKGRCTPCMESATTAWKAMVTDKCNESRAKREYHRKVYERMRAWANREGIRALVIEGTRGSFAYWCVREHKGERVAGGKVRIEFVVDAAGEDAFAESVGI